jgi:hypothetical protein
MATSISLPNGNFAEIYGKEGLRFTLLDSSGKIYNGGTCCKDFFTDAFWAEHHKKPTSIHGFQCTPGRISLEDKHYQIALHFEPEKLEGKALSLQCFLNMIEGSLGIPPTYIEPINEGQDLLLTFHQAWTTRPVMISLFTGLVRVGLMYPASQNETVEETLSRLLKEGNPYGKFDKSEFSKEGVVPLILQCLKEGKEPHPNQSFLQYQEAYSAHHSGGFIAFTTGRATG